MTVTHRRRWRALAAGAALLAAVGIGTVAAVGSHTVRVGAAPSLPAHVLTGYWQDFTNGATPLRLRDVSGNYGLIAVAFAGADTSTPGAITFSVDSGLSSALGGYTDANFTSDIQALHGQGRSVILSVGGADGTVSISDATSAANFANSAFALMQQFGFDGVDIDLEAGINVQFLASALEQLSGKAPGLIITLAPQTIDVQSSPEGAYLQLIDQIKGILTIVNTQYYNSGSMNGCDGNLYNEGNVDFMTAQACILLQHVRADQVGLGLPASSSAAGSGVQPPANMNAALDCLAKGTSCGSFKPTGTFPSIRGAMTWSINWDASNGNAFSGTVGPHLATLGGGGGGQTPTPTPTPTPTRAPTPTPTAAPTPTPTAAPPPPTPVPGNLVANGGFESGSLSPWTCSPLDSVVSSPVHSGSHALAAAANDSDNAQCTQTIAVQPGHSYTLTGWVQGTYAFIGVTGTGTNDTSTFTPSSSSFTQLSVPFTTGASTTSVTVFVHGWYAQGTIFADDFSVS